jgi:hypothetical protein
MITIFLIIIGILLFVVGYKLFNVFGNTEHKNAERHVLSTFSGEKADHTKRVFSVLSYFLGSAFSILLMLTGSVLSIIGIIRLFI